MSRTSVSSAATFVLNLCADATAGRRVELGAGGGPRRLVASDPDGKSAVEYDAVVGPERHQLDPRRHAASIPGTRAVGSHTKVTRVLPFSLPDRTMAG
jgi:hypothetical protein